MQKFMLQHVGYPVAGRSIAEDEWKEYSRHYSFWAAIRKMDKSTEHLQSGQWDDHYRILVNIEGQWIPFSHYEIEEERYNHSLR